ncbi:MAG: helix-turn-helix domain-containing protein [Solirubrobacteraceae bacterium]
MENEHLRTAITRAGLTLEEFADSVGVDVKTVQRWIAGRAAPYRRNRARVAGALDTTEDALWPDTVAAPTTSPGPGTATPAGTDVVAGYGYATNRDAPDPVDMVRSAAERIELILPNLSSDVVDLLLAKAAEGCHARVIIEAADGQVKTLLGIDGIEIYASPGGESYGLYRADEQMLLALHRIGAPGEPSPVILIARRTRAGLFDRLVNEFEERWEKTAPLQTRERLRAYLADAELEPAPESDSESDPRPPPSRSRPTDPSLEAPRRWPGRRT